jgi:hypothetical protein
MSTPTTNRLALRDLPLPAKLVVTSFLISVGLGYIWAMAQIHFQHASMGRTMPSVEDLVARFSGVPWPLEPRPSAEGNGASEAMTRREQIGQVADAVKVKTIIDSRCVRCHKKGEQKGDTPLTTYSEIAKQLQPNRTHTKGRMFSVLHGAREDWDKNMVAAFFEESAGWDKLTAEEQKKEEPRRNAEKLALLAWIEAGAPKADYEADKFPLPATFNVNDLAESLHVKAAPLAPGAVDVNSPQNAEEKQRAARWQRAHDRQLTSEKLTQSTHAHLLTFSVLWALTGIVFAFTSYSTFLRCVLSPLVLVAQVADIACWWLARLEPPVGPYFALAIMGTGAVVGLGLTAQIVLSLWNMYGPKGKLVLAILFLAGAGLFALTYVKVIEPQLEAERKAVDNEGK